MEKKNVEKCCQHLFISSAVSPSSHHRMTFLLFLLPKLTYNVKCEQVSWAAAGKCHTRPGWYCNSVEAEANWQDTFTFNEDTCKGGKWTMRQENLVPLIPHSRSFNTHCKTVSPTRSQHHPLFSNFSNNCLDSSCWHPLYIHYSHNSSILKAEKCR